MIIIPNLESKLYKKHFRKHDCFKLSSLQIVYNGDNLHEMSNPVFWEKIRKYFNMSSTKNFTQSAKH